MVLAFLFIGVSVSWGQAEETQKTLSQQAVEAVYGIWADSKFDLEGEPPIPLEDVIARETEYLQIAHVLDDLINADAESTPQEISEIAFIRELAQMAAEVTDQIARGDSSRFRYSNLYTQPLSRAINQRIRALDLKTNGKDAFRGALKEYGYDIGPAGIDANLTLHQLTQLGAMEQVRAMLDAGTPPDLLDDGGRTALWFACNEGKTDIARLLIARGADINRALENGNTPLIEACIWGYTELAVLLLDNGADLHHQFHPGVTALTQAATYGRWATLKTLIEHGADVNVICQDRGTTPLNIAAGRGHIGVVRLLLENGADPGIADAEGVSPAENARKSGYPEIAAYINGFDSAK